MYPKMDQRKMQKMMKQMGVSTKDIPAEKVIIFTKDKKLIFDKPQVTETTMMGQKTYQLAGNFREEQKEVEISINDDDIELVVAQTGIDKEKAKNLLIKNKGDIAATIMELQK
ncbi:MAG: Nascent polypeptide-associated complex protein [Candidatus Methanofastidiosum methylothiophilum]|uniref:Nascent polypeptide-associated complex protein n=1 Tax=Candidatus Methanofastidiosum methylothiophilum TaxID=1705564 RepID=A0A150ITE4_9EURY|nr:MAG: Nascent polypeptide-associated complex protein [Candidatus Methanofastidiosum methylthiophilus]KYC48192.1 MAG: Nascent polypeptide-associated complex protein [Candidatus Methanofastidiosum methylthiophilus]KYC50847.1 MAG: Nascent polypeptide-associated complex protein [Candidatus Methanofastidiosum methylthiophilus]